MPHIDESLNENSINALNTAQKQETPVQQALNKADPLLSVQQKASLATLLDKYSDVVSSGPNDLGRTNVLYHTIDIEDHGPVRQRLRRLPHDQIPVLKTEVDKLQNARMV